MITPAQQQAQRNRNTIFVEDGEVESIEAFAGDQFIMRLRAPKCAAAAQPGSFVHLTCDASLPMRRPLSIMRSDGGSIDVLFKIVGNGLRLLSGKRPGDRVSVLGPIGQPFRLSPERPNALLIGGGVGIPPMVFIADWIRQDGGSWNPFAILGSEIPFPFELQPSQLPVDHVDADVTSTMPLLESWGIPTRLTSLQDYVGCFRGYVTALAEHWLEAQPAEELERTEVFACGPTPMLRAVADLAARYNVPCQVSLEEYMACAVGGCAGGVVRVKTPDGDAMKRVCVDGPVFDATTIAW